MHDDRSFRSNTSRRVFLTGLAMTSTLLSSPSQTRIKVGCQTNAWPIDPGKTETLYASFAAIKQLGYAGFETGFRNVMPLVEQKRNKEFRDRERGLSFFGVHIFLPQYDPATHVASSEMAIKVAKAGAALGAERLILSGAPCSRDGALDSEAIKRKADALNSIGNETGKVGLKLAYHNHAPEFQGSSREIDALIEQTDPALVWFLLDAGHAFRAKADVPAFIKQNHKRLTGLHLRDFKDGAQVPLGQGDFPLRQVADALQDASWAGWVLAEEEREDGSKPGRDAAGPARKALQQAFGV